MLALSDGCAKVSIKGHMSIKRRSMCGFTARVLRLVSRIPAGHVLTYKKVARLAGSRRAYRAVGNILSRNHDPLVPCHRVVRSDGTVGGYNRGARLKIKLLESEKKGCVASDP